VRIEHLNDCLSGQLLLGEAPLLGQLWNAALPAVVLTAYFLGGLLAYGVRCVAAGPYRDKEIEARGSSVLLGSLARNYFAWVMRPIWGGLLRAHVPANAVTSVSVLLAGAAGVSVAMGRFSLGWLYLCSGACDFLDGRLARAAGNTTAAGAALDSVLDRYSEAAMLVGLAWFYRDQWVLLVILAFLAGSFLVPYTRARGEALGIDMKVGLMQRPERVVILGLATAFGPAFERWVLPGEPGGQPFYYVTVMAIVLLAISTQFTSAYRLFHLTAALAPPTDPASAAAAAVPASPMRVATGLAIASLVDFSFMVLLVRCVPALSDFVVAPWLATGCACFLCTMAHFAVCRSSRAARPAVIAAGAALLNAGGVAVLSLIPELDYSLAWTLTRVAVLCGWNYPMHGLGQFDEEPQHADEP